VVRVPDGVRAPRRRRRDKSERGGYVYLHSAIDGYSRLPYTEALPDEKAVTAIGFLHRARAWFAANGITHIERIVTDNGACTRMDLRRRTRSRPGDLEHPLQLPPTPQRSPRTAPAGVTNRLASYT
jgi:hypothetical protein